MKRELLERSQILRSRHWRPDGRGLWSKRGWELGRDDAWALELIMERELGAVLPRDLAKPRETEWRSRMRVFLENVSVLGGAA